MKILLISPLPPPAGGIATWTVEYLKYCEKKKKSISLVNTALITKDFDSSVKNRNVFDEIKRNIKIVIAVRTKLKNYQPDIVHINSSCSKFGMLRDLICIKLVKKKKKKILLHCHCNVRDMLGQSRISKYIFEWLVSNSDCVLNLNKESLQYVQEIADENKCKLIPNFIAKRTKLKNKVISREITKCVYLGHVKREKGVYDILELARKLPHIVFEVIGPISDELKRCNIPQNVIFYGAMEHEEAMELLELADLFVFPSYSEGFSLSVLEAMAAGLPIVATDVGANREMIENKGGIIVNAGDVEGLYAAINMLNCSDIRKEMSCWNCCKVSENYTADRVLEKIQLIYEELIAV